MTEGLRCERDRTMTDIAPAVSPVIVVRRGDQSRASPGRERFGNVARQVSSQLPPPLRNNTKKNRCVSSRGTQYGAARDKFFRGISAWKPARITCSSLHPCSAIAAAILGSRCVKIHPPRRDRVQLSAASAVCSTALRLRYMQGRGLRRSWRRMPDLQRRLIARKLSGRRDLGKPASAPVRLKIRHLGISPIRDVRKLFNRFPVFPVLVADQHTQ